MRHKLARRGGIPWGSFGLLLLTVAISQAQQYRDSNFECTEAGYHPDPISCTVYYQCVNWGDNSPLTKFKFECGPGTVYSHSKGDICVHPYESERSECSESANDLDSERYEPQSSSSPSYETRPPASSYPDYPSYGSPLPGTSSSGVSSPTVAVLESTTGGYYDNAGYPSLPSTNYPDSQTTDTTSNSDCQQEGFMPHNECHKFIRCVSNGDHSYQRYEFTCGEGTVWDQPIEACNHPWAVSRSDCRVGGGQSSNEPGNGQTPDQSESNEVPHPPGYPGQSGEVSQGYPSTSGPSYPSYPSQQPQGPSGEVSQGYPSTSGPSYPSYPSQQPQQPQGPSREDSQGYPSTSGPSYPSYPSASSGYPSSQPDQNPNEQSTTPDSLYPPPYPEVPSSLPVNPTESPDQSTNEPQQPPSGLYPPPSPPSAGHETGNKPRPDASGDCKEEGFFADPNDCKKFFRCVEGEGIYQKHEFTCGEGTAWDQSLLTCNHEYAVPGCGSEASHGGSNTESSSNEVTGHDKDQTPAGVTASLSPTSTSLQPEESSTTELTVSTTESLSSAASETTASIDTSSSESATEGLTPSESTTSSEIPSSESTTPSEISSSENTTPSESSSSESTTPSEISSSESTIPSDSSSVETTTPSSESSTSPSDIATSPSESSPATDKPEKEKPDESSGSSPSKPSSGKCEAEGFFADPSDCHKFFRCVSFESSSFTKFKFDCGPGTAWDQNLQTCNYEEQVESCEASGGHDKPGSSEGPPESTNEIDSTKEPSQEPTPSTEAEASSPTESTPEGSSPVTESSGPSESTESTSEETSESPEPSSESPEQSSESPEQSSTEEPQTSSSEPDESSSSSESSPDSSSESATPPTGTTISGKPQPGKPQSGKFKCKEEGFFPNPQDCHKFIRCVKVNKGFIKYNFDCGPGTAWDQNLLTCNYEDQVESCEEGAGESESTPQEPGSSSEPNPESTEPGETTEESTTPGEVGEPTEPESTTVEGEETTTSEGGEETTPEGGEETTPEGGEETTPEGGEETTTEGGEETTPEGGEETTTEGGEETTPSTEPEETTPNPSEPEETTPSEVEETTPTNTDETTDGEATTSIEIETTAGISATPPPGSMVTPCPIGNLTDEQIVLVCPTGFKRHPKYCNMFYQCTSENHMEVKILVLACPENLIFDENKIQCLPEEETEQKCDTERASSRFYRKLEDSPVAPVRVTRSSLCPGEGHYPYEEGCSETFYKCQRDSRNDLQGFLYKCPENFVYWSVSRRCERATRLPTCFADNDDNNERKKFWERRKNLPIEKTNLSARSLQL